MPVIMRVYTYVCICMYAFIFYSYLYSNIFFILFAVLVFCCVCFFVACFCFIPCSCPFWQLCQIINMVTVKAHTHTHTYAYTLACKQLAMIQSFMFVHTHSQPCVFSKFLSLALIRVTVVFLFCCFHLYSSHYILSSNLFTVLCFYNHFPKCQKMSIYLSQQSVLLC